MGERGYMEQSIKVFLKVASNEQIDENEDLFLVVVVAIGFAIALYFVGFFFFTF